MAKREHKTPEQRAALYFAMLVGKKVKYVHITKSSGGTPERERTLQLLKDTCLILGYPLIESRSKYTVRLENLNAI